MRAQIKFPLKFEDFQSGLQKQNRFLKIHLATTSIIMAILCFFVIGQKTYFAFSSGPILIERALLEDVCKESFLSFISQSYTPQLHHPDLIKLAESSQLHIDNGEILKLSTIDGHQCKIIFKVNKALRSFVLDFETQSTLPFYYRLIEFNEVEPGEDAK